MACPFIIHSTSIDPVKVAFRITNSFWIDWEIGYQKFFNISVLLVTEAATWRGTEAASKAEAGQVIQLDKHVTRTGGCVRLHLFTLLKLHFLEVNTSILVLFRNYNATCVFLDFKFMLEKKYYLIFKDA